MSNKTANDDLTTAAGVASAIAQHAQSYGIDIVPICRALDINPDDLQSLTARISLDRMCRLFEACAVLSNDDSFGLKCAAVFTLGSSGPFGYGMMTAPTARHLLHFLSDHLTFASQARECRLQTGETDTVLSWTFSPLVTKRDQYLDLIVALHLRHLRGVIGKDIDTVAVGLQRPRPSHPALFRERMTRHISYGMPVNSLHVPTHLLDRTNPSGDETLFKLMDIQLRTLQSDMVGEEEFVDQVRRYIRQRIAEPTLALDMVAAYFGLSERTFQRRLAETDATLNDLRDGERRKLSLTLLSDSNLSISAISYRLGYSAPSAFTRSVYRWFGASPKHLRHGLPGDNDAAGKSSQAGLDRPLNIRESS
jgi:AraC-like DNA-binding protein